MFEFVLTLGAESRLSDSSTICIRFKDKMARNVHVGLVETGPRIIIQPVSTVEVHKV